MTKDVAVCYPDERADVAARLMRDRNVGALVVVGRERQPVGIITDRDFAVSVCANAEDSYYKLVKEVMHAPVVCCRETDELRSASNAMMQSHVHRVPVVDAQGQLVGILSTDDLARSLDADQLKALLCSLSVEATVNARSS
jgi:CBS domain-containing protein